MINKVFSFPSDSAPTREAISIDPRYRWLLWRPKLTSIVPRGLSIIPCFFWWLLHYLRVYRCQDYGVLVIYDGDVLIHRSFVFPKWLRFPFMGDDDLHIAATWTKEDYRGQGLALFALQRIVAMHQRPHRCFWYLAGETNRASIRVAQNGEFVLCGRAARENRFGCRCLGRFQFEEDCDSSRNCGDENASYHND